MKAFNNIVLILLTYSLCSFCILAQNKKIPNALTQSGNLICNSQIRSQEISTNLSGNLYASNTDISNLSAFQIFTNKVTTNELRSSLIVPKNANRILQINSFLRVAGELTYRSGAGNAMRNKKKEDDPDMNDVVKELGKNNIIKNPTTEMEKIQKASKTSFIQVDSLVINDVKQWQHKREDNLMYLNRMLNPFFLDFFLKSSPNLYYLNAPKNDAKILFRDHLKKQLNKKNNEWKESINEEVFEIEKSYFLEKNFSHAMLELEFKFVNEFWVGNTAYIKVNDHIYWMDNHHWSNSENTVGSLKSFCKKAESNANVLHESEKWSTPIKIIYRGNKQTSNINVKFGIKMNKNSPLNSIKFENCQKAMKLGIENNLIDFQNLKISIK